MLHQPKPWYNQGPTFSPSVTWCVPFWAPLRVVQSSSMSCGVSWMVSLCRVSSSHGFSVSLQENLLFSPPGAQYVTCLTSNHTDEAELVILFTSSYPGNLTEETCSALCYADDQEYGGFSPQGQCLCGTAHEPSSSSSCLLFCTEHSSGQACGGPSLIHFPFQAQLSVSFIGLKPRYSLHEAVLFNVSIPIAVSTLIWEFGDQTEVLNTTGNAAVHTYALPGQYNVTATLFVGTKVSYVQAEIEVVASPQQLELQCPSLIKTNESLDIRIRNRGGTGLTVLYGITAESGEPGRGKHGCLGGQWVLGKGEGGTGSWGYPLCSFLVRRKG